MLSFLVTGKLERRREVLVTVEERSDRPDEGETETGTRFGDESGGADDNGFGVHFHW